jgi:hypothetical protein
MNDVTHILDAIEQGNPHAPAEAPGSPRLRQTRTLPLKKRLCTKACRTRNRALEAGWAVLTFFPHELAQSARPRRTGRGAASPSIEQQHGPARPQRPYRLRACLEIDSRADRADEPVQARPLTAGCRLGKPECRSPGGNEEAGIETR